MNGRLLLGVGGGVGFVLIVSSLILEFSAIWLGVGFLLLVVSLVFLQLSFWKEGDRRPPRAEPAEYHFDAVSAPQALQHNPRLMNLWKGMEVTRKLMEEKSVSAAEDEKQREKVSLRLSDAEHILFMEELSCKLFWPLALVSGLFLLTSAWAAGETVASFMCLVAGLSGLLVLSLMKGQTKFYLTSHRALVRKRSLWKRVIGWNGLRYEDVQRCIYDFRPAGGRISLAGERLRLEISGLAGSPMTQAVGILREILPAEVMCKNPS